jgi:putative transposase
VNQTAHVLRPTQDDVRADLRGLLLRAVQVALTAVLEEELEMMIGAARGQRTRGRRDERNGSYTRGLLTSMGPIELEMPRSRKSGSPVGVVGRYQRRAGELDDAICSAYVNGVSTRKMGKVTTALLGEDVGRSSVSRVTKRLEESVESLRTEKLEGSFPYLLLDATFLDARWARTVENVAALVAYGVGQDGHRKLLAITIGSEESEASWAELLSQLLDRGLTGVRLVIADDHRGLTKAVRRLLPEAELQRCTVHLQRNVLSHTPQKLRRRVAREVSAIFKAPSKKDAQDKLTRFKAGLGAHVPEALKCLEDGFTAATRFYEFPKEHWLKIRSTNGLERLHGELKRRIRAVGAFPDRQSALRLVTAVALQVTRIWEDRRYLDMSKLATPRRVA